MTLREIAERWIANNGEIRPVNPYATCDPLELFSAFKIRQFKKDEFDVANEQHTYPCPTLADGEYRGGDLDFEWIEEMPEDSQLIICLKQPPAIDAGERAEEKTRSVPYYELHDNDRIFDTSDKSEAALYYTVDRGLNSKITVCFLHAVRWHEAHALKGYVRVDEVLDILSKRQSGYISEMQAQGKEWEQPDYLACKVNEITDIITQIKQLSK